MRNRTTLKMALAAALALVASAAFAALALGVRVYSNDFSSKAEYQQIGRSGGGKACERRHRSKQDTMLVSVKRGPLTCGFKVPVEGDSELPNHAIGLETKLLSSTAKSVRKAAFAEVTLRAGGGGVGYTLRVFPARKKFQLTRGPGGGEFPARGRSKAIKGVNERNDLSLTAKGARVTAKVNGKQLASVQDGDPGQVSGRKVRFGVGSKRKSSKDVAMVLRSVGVGVPTR